MWVVAPLPAASTMPVPGLRMRWPTLIPLVLLIATAMITIMLIRPRGLWPSSEHGKGAPSAVPAGK